MNLSLANAKERNRSEMTAHASNSCGMNVGEYPSPHSRQRPSVGQTVLVSSSFLRYTDETKNLLEAQHQIGTIGADGAEMMPIQKVTLLTAVLRCEATPLGS